MASIGKNRELGKNGKLLWQIHEDFKRMKQITMGHPIVMGRRTFEAVGRVLPGRTNIIITRDKDYKVEGGIVADSLEKAIAEAQKSSGADEIFIFGGGEVYKQAIDVTDKLYLTVIDAEDKEADTYFPDYADFKKVVSEQKGEEGDLNYEFLELTR